MTSIANPILRIETQITINEDEINLLNAISGCNAEQVRAALILAIPELELPLEQFKELMAQLRQHTAAVKDRANRARRAFHSS